MTMIIAMNNNDNSFIVTAVINYDTMTMTISITKPATQTKHTKH